MEETEETMVVVVEMVEMAEVVADPIPNFQQECILV